MASQTDRENQIFREPICGLTRDAACAQVTAKKSEASGKEFNGVVTVGKDGKVLGKVQKVSWVYLCGVWVTGSLTSVG
jgi:hypothetical protein